MSYGGGYGGGGGDGYGGGGGYGGSGGGRFAEVAPISANLHDIDKASYDEHPAVKNRSKAEVRKYRKEHNISVVGANCPNPATTLLESSFPANILAEIERSGFTKPTLIQGQSWPVALSGRDVFGVARKGSGKTWAYILPAILHIQGQSYLNVNDGPIVLVLAPTRKVADQIKEDCVKFDSCFPFKCTCVYGGSRTEKQAQANDLKRGVEIVIAIPHCLVDFLRDPTRNLNLKRVTYLVLDDADRMLAKGFENQLRYIIDQIRPDRQMLVFTSTTSLVLNDFVHQFLGVDKVEVRIGSTLVLLVGLQGSGKSTFASGLLQQGWRIISQNELSDKRLCIYHCAKALAEGLNVVIDRCNVSRSEREDWITAAEYHGAYVGSVVLDMDSQTCIERVMEREGHPTLPPGPDVARIVNRTVANWIYPASQEGILFNLVIKSNYSAETVYRQLLKRVHGDDYE